MSTLHLMVGLPCSGKTTLAKNLERELDAFRLTPDEWHRYLYGQDGSHPDHDKRHSNIEVLQWNIAEPMLKRGLDVILDFGFWTKAEREDFKQRAMALGSTTRIHFLNVPHEVLLERLKIRNKQHPDEVTIISPSQMKTYFQRFEPPSESEMMTASNTEQPYRDTD